jgi:hypothetical protein
MPELKAGSRLKSVVCTTEVIVVKAPAGAVEVTCGGTAMATAADTVERTEAPAAGKDTGTALGKRYVNADETLEILVTKAGSGTLGQGDDPLSLKEAKPLPASD